MTYKKTEKVVSGGDAFTTNNKMELLAAISGLEAIKKDFGCEIILYTDSKYVVDGISKNWARGWRARGWTKSDKSPALNPELWDRLLRAIDALGGDENVKFMWIKGHNGHPYNERCDKIAKGIATNNKNK